MPCLVRCVHHADDIVQDRVLLHALDDQNDDTTAALITAAIAAALDPAAAISATPAGTASADSAAGLESPVHVRAERAQDDCRRHGRRIAA